MEKREKRYYLVNDILYELAINFEQMTYGLYIADEKNSCEDNFAMDKVVLTGALSVGGFLKEDELTEIEKFRIIHNCMSTTRQMLKHKYNTETSKVNISVFEKYETAYKEWKEEVDKREKAKAEIKKCTLDKVILEDDVKEDILSTINYIKNIDKYKEMGCETPSGILLEGEPGTGKTLIAKTIADETNMNFKSVVASDLVQKYVGDSAKRIGKEFDELAEKGGGVIFIDEIDAIGGNRNSSEENKEYRAALNKLLACMADASDQNIIVICATNVKDQLDPALIREGRIDKIINIPLPDFDSRIELFKLYIGKLKHEDDMNYLDLARMTEGKTGAFIAACCNHSGIYAVNQGAKTTNYEHVTHTLNRMLEKREKKTNTIGFC